MSQTTHLAGVIRYQSKQNHENQNKNLVNFLNRSFSKSGISFDLCEWMVEEKTYNLLLFADLINFSPKRWGEIQLCFKKAVQEKDLLDLGLALHQALYTLDCGIRKATYVYKSDRDLWILK